MKQPRKSIRMMKPARIGKMNIAAKVARLPSEMERGSRERSALYQSREWRRARAEFLREHRFCCRCGAKAVIVDHVDGHQRADWRERFWDRSLWKPMCGACHAAKSARELAAWREAGEAAPEGYGVLITHAKSENSARRIRGKNLRTLSGTMKPNPVMEKS